MIKKSLIASAACLVLACAQCFASNNKTQVNFDQGPDVNATVSAIKSQAEKAGELTAFGEIKTYTVSSRHITRAMGFLHKSLPKSDWEPESVSASRRGIKIPDTLDLRPKLTPIEDQGQCGSCWAFSLTATNRDGHALNGADPGRLSQEWLVDNSPEADGCNGGDFDSANDLMSPGQPPWNSCPYKEGAGACPAVPVKPVTTIAAWHMLGKAGQAPSVRDIEAYMTSSGKPVSIAIAAGVGDWENYQSGVYNGCTSGPLDHMINIVGWDNQGAKFDKTGNLPPGKGIWILRNSWGTSWGENGYMLTQMTDPAGNRCNAVAQEAAYFDFQ